MKIFLRGVLLVLLAFGFPSTAPAQVSDTAYFEKGITFFPAQLDSVLHYFALGSSYYFEQKNWGKYVDCLNGSSSCYNLMGDLRKSKNYIGLALQEAKRYLPKDSPPYCSALHNSAFYYSQSGQLDKAIKYFKETLEIEKSDQFKPLDRVVTLNNLGATYVIKGDYGEGLSYYHKSINLQKKHGLIWGINAGHSLLQMAEILETTHDLDSARYFLQQGLDLLTNPKCPQGEANNNFQIDIHLLFAKIYLQEKKTDLFKFHIRQVRRLSPKSNKEGEIQASTLHGQYAMALKDYPNALRHFKTANKLALQKYKGLKRDRDPEIGRTFYNLGEACHQRNKLTACLKYYQQALIHFSNDFHNHNLYLNPKPGSLIPNVQTLKTLKGKARALYSVYKEKPIDNTAYLKASNDTYQLAMKVSRQIRQSYLGEGSKEILADQVQPIYEGALQGMIKNFELTGDSSLLQNAFDIVESSKAILLLESINENTAKGFAGIPDSLLFKEKELKLEITFHQRSIHEARERLVTTEAEQITKNEKISRLEEGLFDFRQRHQQLLELFEKKYPRYHHLKHDQRLTSLTEAQKQLPNETSALLEYFVGQEKIYLFYLTRQKVHFQKIDRSPSLTQDVETLRHALINPPNHQKAQQELITFSQVALRLYQDLVEVAPIDSSIEHLLIIPDDLLGYIPFEVLLQQAPKTMEIDYSPDNLNYLINDYQISYHYSSTLWQQSRNLRKRTGRRKNFIGFAPSFGQQKKRGQVFRDCTSDELYSLQCNKKEVEEISDLFGGTSLTDATAAKASFQREAPNYRILHLATHSCLDDNNPMLNKIFLADGYLTNYDLYNIELQADLAVLSACNTGNGPLQRGEGVMSLSRGFIHAGCPSTLISFWSVEDCTTLDIMTTYYQELLDGSTKDYALQMAKKVFLQQADQLHAHPFYWAPFVQFGDTSPLDLASRKKGWWYLGLLIILGGLAFWLFNRIKKA